jgi:hypothetical protein
MEVAALGKTATKGEIAAMRADMASLKAVLAQKGEQSGAKPLDTEAQKRQDDAALAITATQSPAAKALAEGRLRTSLRRESGNLNGALAAVATGEKAATTDREKMIAHNEMGDLLQLAGTSMPPAPASNRGWRRPIASPRPIQWDQRAKALCVHTWAEPTRNLIPPAPPPSPPVRNLGVSHDSDT